LRHSRPGSRLTAAENRHRFITDEDVSARFAKPASRITIHHRRRTGTAKPHSGMAVNVTAALVLKNNEKYTLRHIKLFPGIAEELVAQSLLCRAGYSKT